jgi:hypothetical protein
MANARVAPGSRAGEDSSAEDLEDSLPNLASMAAVVHQNLAESLEAFARGELTRSKSTGGHRKESLVGRFLIGVHRNLIRDL